MSERSKSGEQCTAHSSQVLLKHCSAADLEGNRVLLRGSVEHLVTTHEGGGHAAVQREALVGSQFVAMVQALLRGVRQRLRIPHLQSAAAAVLRMGPAWT